MTAPSEAQEAVEKVFREERGRVLAAVRRLTNSLEEAEDHVATALSKALLRWPEDGVPERPGAWLLSVAKNEALGVIRHRKMAATKEYELSVERGSTPPREESEYPDDRLRLLFTCCHPALDEHAQIALTLSTLSGLSTKEIARAFVTSETTMAQRLVRVKKKLKSAGIPYAVPERSELIERTSGVLRVIYLIFTEGYRASFGEQRLRIDLCEDALLLVQALNLLLPELAEAEGLESLLWFHHARREARTNPAGGVVFLEDQDRSLFSMEEIARGAALLDQALARKALGVYQLQAAIAGAHCLAPSFKETPWESIIALYDKLQELEPSPIVSLNRAGAIGLHRGPASGLLEMERAGLSRSLDDYCPYHSARGELLRRLQRFEEAKSAFERALALAGSAPERSHIESRISACEASVGS